MSSLGHAFSLCFLKLHCANEDVIDGVVCIFKAVIFKPTYSSGSSLTDTRLMDSVLPLLLHLLDERDGAARAVVKLIAEYCSVYFFRSFHLFNTLWQQHTYGLSLGL